MNVWGEIDQKLPTDYVNNAKDELRKVNDIELARQILDEAGVDLTHVSGNNPYTFWGNGIAQARRQGTFKRVLERARHVVSTAAVDGGTVSANCLAKLITEYNQAVISAAAENGRSLSSQLAELDRCGEPGDLRRIAIEIRRRTSEIRQRLDDDEQFKVLPLQTEEYTGPSPDQRRERLTKKCYRVIVAADQVSRLARLLSYGNDQESGDEDEDWDVVAVDPVFAMMREQYAQREINDCKLRLAARVRRLLRDLRTIPLESKSEA